MILYKGELLENNKQKELLDSLKDDCLETLSNTNLLEVDDVINACDKLAKKVKNNEFDNIIIPLLDEFDIPYDYFKTYIKMFEKDSLIEKVKTELGEYYDNLSDLDSHNKREIHPLGILFHIAAGNVDILPAYSVIEGLLSRNINILKLPTGDKGLSVKLLNELIKIEAKLKPYIYVFDVPSTEINTLKQFADIADAIIVWGGDEAIKAARSMASINTKIIEWGHKLSFAYSSLDVSDDQLIDLAHHMASTNQVLCSSAQGIFVDTNNRIELDKFAERFFNIFKEVNKEHKEVPYGMKSKNALTLYYEDMIKHKSNKRIWKENGISVITSDDSELELSNMFRSIWVKMLPSNLIISKIKPFKNYLQTVGLLCPYNQITKYTEILVKTGVTRITKAKDMSRMLNKESHDGMYALRLYTKIVEILK